MDHEQFEIEQNIIVLSTAVDMVFLDVTVNKEEVLKNAKFLKESFKKLETILNNLKE